MPSFKYIARSRSGERIEGTIEAPDKRGALLQIERMGQVAVSVAEGGALAGPALKAPAAKKSLFTFERRRSSRIRMKLREVLLLSRELSDLLASGMTLGSALHTLSQRDTHRAQDAVVQALRDDIVQGTSLSAALAKWPDTFSPLYVSMVRAGEASGQLAEVFEQLCRHYERVQEAREKVVMALIYPMIVLSVGVVTMIFTLLVVVPRFSTVFEQLGGTLPLPTQIMIGVSSGLLKYGWAILIGATAGTILVRRAIRTPAGRRSWHKLQLRLPLARGIVSANAYAHFARTLSTLLKNGVPVLQALTIVEDTVGNVIIAEAVRDARSRVTDGATISGPLAQGRIFPPLLTDMLAVGEQSGDMSSALAHIAKRYDTELDRSVKILTTALEPIMIVVMALLVGFIAMSMLLAVFDMTSGLNV